MATQLLGRGVRTPRPTAVRKVPLYRRFDSLLLISTLALTFIGLLMIDSTGTEFVQLGDTAHYGVEHQFAYAVVALFVLIFFTVVDYHRFEDAAYLIYGLVLLSLLATRALGHSAYGAVREISVGPLTIQPSEFGVVAVIFVVGLYVSRHESELDLRHLGVLLLLAGVPMLLVLTQPDIGTTLITGLVFLSLLYFSGLRMRYIVGLVLIVCLAGFVAYEAHLVSSYQLSRLKDYFSPNSAAAASSDGDNSTYAVNFSKLAIGAGGLRGAGLFHGQLTYLKFVPIQYEDFIFSAVGEQLGFIGSALVIGLYSIMSLRIFRAMQLARDTLGRLVCGGALVFLVVSVVENIGMATGLTPVTGIPLPFISYGGSALFAFYAAMGLVLNVELHRPRPR